MVESMSEAWFQLNVAVVGVGAAGGCQKAIMRGSRPEGDAAGSGAPQAHSAETRMMAFSRLPRAGLPPDGGTGGGNGSVGANVPFRAEGGGKARRRMRQRRKVKG